MKRIILSWGGILLTVGLIGCMSQPLPPTSVANPAPVAVASPPVDPPRPPSPTLAQTPTSIPVPTVQPSPTVLPATSTPIPATPVPTPTTVKPAIELPVPTNPVVLPLHILARVGTPGDKVTAELRWKDGTLLKRNMTVVAGEDGHGLVIDTLGWDTESQPPQPPTQSATLSLRASNGAVLVQQSATVLADNDPATKEVTLYWVGGDKIHPITRKVPKTAQIGAATIEELLWGPNPWNLAGFTTSLPTPDEVLHFPARESDWGPRVTLRKLTIVDGVATVDFSKEMKAFSGGAARVTMLRQQIASTLKQFSTIKDVRISIEGQTEGILQP